MKASLSLVEFLKADNITVTSKILLEIFNVNNVQEVKEETYRLLKELLKISIRNLTGRKPEEDVLVSPMYHDKVMQAMRTLWTYFNSIKQEEFAKLILDNKRRFTESLAAKARFIPIFSEDMKENERLTQLYGLSTLSSNQAWQPMFSVAPPREIPTSNPKEPIYKMDPLQAKIELGR